ncbi:MAG: glutamate formimidoyltransferase [Haliscomenobacter sp.]|uniref:glutamate formimidoyltransferase n=1 Tax=Haliscomenobacter sp. TaxID=2717303 RepID=UPI0029ADE7B8|nr:glutamate formimidoyltransferase [Haliscomenobacter sp.]MDX2069646.1 glutamate formimidoyltransferase [Haliscomenobacter sp.]
MQQVNEQPLLECVPNFSEGRNPELIEAIAASIRQVKEVSLLHVDPGFDANRTVMTFVGPPLAVVEAAFQSIRTAAQVIDMRQQQGAHPRIGATDVCPLVPIKGLTMEEAVKLAQQLGQRIGIELNIPVYLYEYAATAPHRRNLAHVRQGEYEGLAAKIRHPEWYPDFGPKEGSFPAGATVLGARKFLIAYNVNLNTKDPKVAQRIAERVRESGYLQQDGHDHKQRIPGRCPGVKAIGWYMPAYGKAQVSMNITDLDQTPLHLAFEACCEEAQQLGFKVTGSELIGLAPLRVFLEAGQYYDPYETDPDRLIDVTITHLGLQELRRFERGQRILEDQLKR